MEKHILFITSSKQMKKENNRGVIMRIRFNVQDELILCCVIIIIVIFFADNAMSFIEYKILIFLCAGNGLLLL